MHGPTDPQKTRGHIGVTDRKERNMCNMIKFYQQATACAVPENNKSKAFKGMLGVCLKGVEFKNRLERKNIAKHMQKPKIQQCFKHVSASFVIYKRIGPGHK